MQIHLGDDPFRMWLRREENYENTCAVRFEAEHGRALLSMRMPGRSDPEATSHYEEESIGMDALRQGRFIHVLPGGNRRSYTLSRLTAELINRLPTNRWVELEALTEFGFRYLVFPKSLPLAESNKVATPPGSAAASTATPVTAVASAPRPKPVAKTTSMPPTPRPPIASRPPRQTPVAPELAHEALAQLSHPAAIQHLKMEMAKVEALHQRLDELERKLSSSQVRERDLLGVLQKWQAMD